MKVSPEAVGEAIRYVITALSMTLFAAAIAVWWILT